MLFLFSILYFSRILAHAIPAPLVLRDSSILSSPSSSPSILAVCTCSNARSIWDIIWSCVATIFACSWVSVHPNIPAPGEKWWRGFLQRLEYMVWTILAPEAVIYWAMRQWFGARKVAKEYQTHGWTNTHGHYLLMGGFMLYQGETPKAVLSEGCFRELLNHAQIQFPSITKEDIDDRSKSDALAKAVAVIQTGWFVVQCIARKVEGLVMTEFELLTLALASLNAFMYFFWWDKPMDVGTSVPVYLVEKSEPENEDTTKSDNNVLITHSRPRVSTAHSVVFWAWPKALITAIIQRFGDILVWGEKRAVQPGDMQVPTFYASFERQQGDIAAKFAALIGLLFGAIHCAGWNFFFPTRAELIIWRVCSLIIVGIPAFLTFPQLVLNPIVEWTSMLSMVRMLAVLLLRGVYRVCVLLSPVYIVARMLLLVEAVITLRDLPAGAYDDIDWTSFLPHV